MKYLSGYPENVKKQVAGLIRENRLGDFILGIYPERHTITTDRALYDFTMELKNRFFHKSHPVNRVMYDSQLNAAEQVLGMHYYISRVHGSRIKTKNEIRISTLFKKVPVEFLRLLVVHELAHLREKEHNRSFFKLCEHMEPDYYMIEFHMLLYLTFLETGETLYK